MSAFTEANRQAFNDLADKYHSQPWQRAMTALVQAGLHARKDWLGVRWADEPHSAPSPTPRLLDYACGTGAITQALGPWVGTIRGVDISENMVAAYNRAARAAGLTEQQAYAVVGDLTSASGSGSAAAAADGPEFHDFDLAVVGLGFHHFEAPGRAIARLAERLKPGAGVLVIIDLLPGGEGDAEQDGTLATPSSHHHSHHAHTSFPAMAHTIHQDGFTAAQMADYFGAAGLLEFGFEVLDQPAVMELAHGTVRRRVFIARGRRG